jgi:hypothetical protein
MTEIWTSSEKGNDSLIAFIDGTIYKGNFKTFEETDDMAKAIKAGSFDSRRLWEIRTRNCKEIRLQDGNPFIEIFFGKEGEEQLRITDEYNRNKVFEFIKANTPNAVVKTEKWNAFRAGRKPMIAFFVVLGFFLWTLYYVIEAQNGTVYYIENGSYFSLTGIVLGIASLGLAKVVIIFSVLSGLAVFSFVRKTRKPPIMTRIFPSRDS